MLEDLAIGFRRIAYDAAHGSPWSPAAAALLLKLGELIAVHLDDNPAGPTRVTRFVFSGKEPNREIPPDQGQPRLSPAEEGFVEAREEDAL